VRNRGEAIYLEEIERAVRALPHIRFHLHVSDEMGFLTGLRLAELSRQPALADVTAFLCGPPPMMHSLRRQCRQLGMGNANIISEEFAMR
jgi:predicted ferric reductase